MPDKNTKRFSLDLIRKNTRLFLNYNKLRTQYVYELNHDKAVVAFKIIPSLLNINHPDLPGYVAQGEDVCGIYDITSYLDLRKVINDFFPETGKKDIPFQKYLVRRPFIESLFTIGSIGTVAQTDKSDFDIWVCIDDSKATSKGINRLTSKVDLISRWCQTKFNMEVHFFVSPLEKIRENDFGRVDEESTGSSQRKFLKEECYRTLLLLCGKIPFWWVVPPGINQENYSSFWEHLIGKDPLYANDFIELGHLGDVSREEFLGTALWHLTKGIKDPFKAILKMAMMERYLSDDHQDILLCDILKMHVQEGSKALMDMDPYLLLAETILDFYNAQKRFEERDLIQKAFYIKAQPDITRAKLKKRLLDYQTEVFKELINKWNWPLELAEELNHVENWSYSRQVGFAQDINKFFFSTYRQLSGILNKEKEQAINAEDLNLLGRKIFVLFSKQKNKLQLMPMLGNRQLILEKCIFKYFQDRSGNRRWSVYDGTRYPSERQRRISKIFSADRITRAAAWLIVNGIYDFHQTVLEIPINPPGVSISDLTALLKHLEKFFLPASQQKLSNADYQHNAGFDKIMAIIDMEEKKTGPNSVLDIIYSNTWGEIFTESYPFQKGLFKIKEYVLRMTAKNTEELISKVKIHIPNSIEEMAEKRNIYEAIFKGLTS